MDQAERNAGIGTWLRRIWSAVISAAEAMDRSPIEVVFDRLDRLEHEMAALKGRKAAGIGDRTQEHMRADVLTTRPPKHGLPRLQLQTNVCRPSGCLGSGHELAILWHRIIRSNS
jgi:hypothetical protein